MGEATKFAVADVTVDVVGRRVVRGGAVVPLQRKPFDLLVYLLRQGMRVVDKDEIYRELWPNEFVGDASLSMSIAKIRKAIGDDSGAPKIIETVYGVGYRLIAEVRSVASAVMEPSAIRSVRATTTTVVVGREPELSALRAAWEQAVAGDRCAVLVVGEAGIGKSALVRAFLDILEGEAVRPRVLRGDCLDLSTCDEPFQPLLDAWSLVCRGDDAATTVGVLRRFAPAWLHQLDGVVDASERAGLQVEARRTSPAKLLRTHSEALAALASDRPVVLIVEDVHWADTASLDALARLVRDHSPARLLVLLTARPIRRGEGQRGAAVVDAIDRSGRGRVVRLERLPRTSIEGFLHAHEVASVATQATCEALFERTRGHPLFLAAAAHHLACGGRVDEVPPDLRDFLHRQLDALDSESVRLVQVAGALGVEFETGLVAAAVERTLADVEETLLAIARDRGLFDVVGEISWPDGTECRSFRFVHAYYAQTAVDRAARTRLPVWHRRIAARLEAAHPDGLPATVAMRVARHFARAGERVAALEAWHRAVSEAQGEGAYERLRTAAEHALALLESLPPGGERDRREIELRLALLRALVVTDGFPAESVATNCECLLARARSVDDFLARLTALLVLSAVYQVRGDVRRAIAFAEEMVDSAAAMPEAIRIVVQAWLGFLYAFGGDFLRARPLLEAIRSVPVADRMRGVGIDLWVDPDVVFAGYEAIVLLMSGQADAARERDATALERARAGGHAYSLVTALLVHANYLLLMGDIEGFRKYAREAATLAEHEGLMKAANHLRAYRDAADVLEAPTPEGALVLRASLAAAERNGERLESVPLRIVLALAYSRIGDGRATLTVLDEALAFIEESGERIAEAEVRRLRARSLLAEDSGAAHREFAAAMSRANSQGARLVELRLAIDRLGMARDGRARTAARRAMREIYETFRDGFDLPELVKAAALLGEGRRNRHPCSPR